MVAYNSLCYVALSLERSKSRLAKPHHHTMSKCPVSAASQPYTAASKTQSSVEEFTPTLLSTHSIFEDRPHERHIIQANVGSVNTTWLDLYPPTETSEESASPASPAPNLKRLTRINKIKEILANDIKSSIEIRKYFLWLKNYGKEVCSSCFATKDPLASCGSTCAHLRPQISSRVASFIDSPWRTDAVRSVKTYHRILEEIEEKGNLARNSQILKWEKAAQGLKKDTLNQSETKDKNGWSSQDGYSKAKKAGVDIEWTFGSAWGTSLPPDEDVAPDEDVR